jgi:hypothetical protein
MTYFRVLTTATVLFVIQTWLKTSLYTVFITTHCIYGSFREDRPASTTIWQPSTAENSQLTQWSVDKVSATSRSNPQSFERKIVLRRAFSWSSAWADDTAIDQPTNWPTDRPSACLHRRTVTMAVARVAADAEAACDGADMTAISARSAGPRTLLYPSYWRHNIACGTWLRILGMLIEQAWDRKLTWTEMDIGLMVKSLHYWQ